MKNKISPRTPGTKYSFLNFKCDIEAKYLYTVNGEIKYINSLFMPR